MFKLVVLFAVAAVAAANPNGVWPVAHTAVVPGVTTVSQYDTSIVHPSYGYAAPALYGASLYNTPYHRLHKRSLAYAPAVSYSNIVSPWATGYGYGARYAAPWGSALGLGYGYGAAYPTALSVHPW